MSSDTCILCGKPAFYKAYKVQRDGIRTRLMGFCNEHRQSAVLQAERSLDHSVGVMLHIRPSTLN